MNQHPSFGKQCCLLTRLSKLWVKSIRYVEHRSEELTTVLGRKYKNTKKMVAYSKRKFVVVRLESVSVSKSLNQSTDQELRACMRSLKVGHQAEEARQKPMAKPRSNPGKMHAKKALKNVEAEREKLILVYVLVGDIELHKEHSPLECVPKA
jgi:hypothetical protein